MERDHFKGVAFVVRPGGGRGGAPRTQENFEHLQKLCFQHIYQNSLKPCIKIPSVQAKNTKGRKTSRNFRKNLRNFRKTGEIFVESHKRIATMYYFQHIIETSLKTLGETFRRLNAKNKRSEMFEKFSRNLSKKSLENGKTVFVSYLSQFFTKHELNFRGFVRKSQMVGKILRKR